MTNPPIQKMTKIKTKIEVSLLLFPVDKAILYKKYFKYLKYLNKIIFNNLKQT